MDNEQTINKEIALWVKANVWLTVWAVQVLCWWAQVNGLLEILLMSLLGCGFNTLLLWVLVKAFTGLYKLIKRGMSK